LRGQSDTHTRTNTRMDRTKTITYFAASLARMVMINHTIRSRNTFQRVLCIVNQYRHPVCLLPVSRQEPEHAIHLLNSRKKDVQTLEQQQ